MSRTLALHVRDLMIAAVMAAAVGGFVLWQKASTPAPVVSGVATTTPAGGLTMESVAVHHTRADCWTVINGGVYDLTSWIPQHPGGETAILRLCGTDGSASFNGQHGGAATQAAILAGFKVGTLGDAAVSPASAASAGTSGNTAGVDTPATVPGDAIRVDDSGRGRGRGGDDISVD